VQIYDAKKPIGITTGQPGEVTAVSDASLTVAAAGGQIEVLRVRPAGGQKISAAAFASSVGLRPGAQLGV
jgi:methionyl-tRNA formyltransferase